MSDKKAELEKRLVAMHQRHAQERGARLKEERKRLGLSKIDFANMLGIHRNTQGNYEAGREPPIPYLLAVQEAGVDVAYVMEGERHTGAATQCAHVVSRMFETAARLGVTDLHEEAMASLAYLLAQDEEQQASGFAGCLDDGQTDELVRWAFSAGTEFAEACSAIELYGSASDGPAQELGAKAGMILETLNLYQANRQSLRLSVRDNVRLVAEDVVKARGK